MTSTITSDTREPLAPDFHAYPWDALDSAVLENPFLQLRWPDGTTLLAFDRWLYENAVGLAVDPVTRESTLDPAHLPLDLRIDHAAIDADGALEISWLPGGARTRHHPGWLRHVADDVHGVTSWLPEPRAWTAGDLPQPPTHDGAAVLADDDALLAWANDIATYGIARLRGAPTAPDFGAMVARRLGPIRDTNFGLVWDVRAEVDPSSLAYTRVRLGPHTDLPTRETPPGFQMLHCLVNEVEGGEATMADGMAVVDHLRAHHPSDHEALTTHRWIFGSRGRGIDHRWSAPLVELAEAGRPLTIRAFHPVRSFPDMPAADMPGAYDAIRRFSQVADDPAFRMRFRYEPGDLVCFDNRRVLHGRDSFSTGGLRHLRGLYLDHDDVRSFLRVANRRAAAARY